MNTYQRKLIIDIIYVIFSLTLIGIVLFWDKIIPPSLATNTTNHTSYTGNGNGNGNGMVENFVASRDNNVFFGNLVAYKSVDSGIPTNTVIQLPGRVRITGISTKTFTSDDSTPIRIYIADNTTNVRSADTRTEIIDPRLTGNTSTTSTIPTLKSDIDYNDYLNVFEDRDYIGSALLLEIPSEINASTNMPTIPNNNIVTKPNTTTVIESITVYGISINSLGKSDYDKMPLITSTETNNIVDIYRVTIPNGNIKVGYLHIPGLQVHTNFAVQIQYSNSLDNNSSKFNINGPNQLHWSNGHPYIYIGEPIIAQNIYISVPNKDLRRSILSLFDKGINVYGFPATSRDIVNFKLRSTSGTGGGMGSGREKIGLVISGKKCPNVNEMMHKQLQAQQICEALEYKDKAKNKRIAYEKEKEFLKKLQTQDTEIKNLESIIDRLMTRKQQRLESSEGHNMEEVDREFKHLSDLKKDVEQHLANTKAPTSGLRLAVDLHPK